MKDELHKLNGYVARREYKELIQSIQYDPNRLEPYGFKVYSQADEDGIIQEIFNRLNITDGNFIEIGVGTGLECNTLYLLHKGWKGEWIDHSEQSVEQKFQSLIETATLIFTRTKITIENIRDLVNYDVDFLSIDVDGMDIHLLKALEAKPAVICIEYNAKFPPPLSKVPVYNPDFVWQGTDYFGASLSAIDNVAINKGYTLVGTNITGVNAFFVRNDLVGDKFTNWGTKYIYNPPRYWLNDAFDVGHPPDFGPYEDMQ